MPLDGSDCLCPDCLRKAARALGSFNVKSLNMTGQWNVGAVLLDMDGTLLDTERVYYDSLVAALHAHGYTDDTATLCQAMVGLPGPDCEAMLHARYGERFPLAEISKAFISNRDEFLCAGLPLKPGRSNCWMRCRRPSARWRSSPPPRYAPPMRI